MENGGRVIGFTSPEGASVNDGIRKDLCPLQYVKVDEVADTILRLGSSTELVKIDIYNAYRIVPVHPDNRPLLGMKWQGKLYVDTTLPFGLRLAPKIFNAAADAANGSFRKWELGICGTIWTILLLLEQQEKMNVILTVI